MQSMIVQFFKNELNIKINMRDKKQTRDLTYLKHWIYNVSGTTYSIQKLKNINFLSLSNDN
jgi:hypothetical protein